MLTSPSSTFSTSYSARTSKAPKLSAAAAAVDHVGFALALRAADVVEADVELEVVRRKADLAEQREHLGHRNPCDCRSVDACDADREVEVAEERVFDGAARLAEIEVAGFDREVLVEAVAAEDLEAVIAVVRGEILDALFRDLRRAEAGAHVEARRLRRPERSSRPSARG